MEIRLCVKKDLAEIQPYYNFLLMSEGEIKNGELYYLPQIEGLYFYPQIIFRHLASDEQIPKRTTPCDVQLVFNAMNAVVRYYQKLSDNISKVSLPKSLATRLEQKHNWGDFELQCPDGLFWYFSFLHLDTACGRVSNMPCQSCDNLCAGSFGSCIDDLSPEEAERRYLEDWNRRKTWYEK